MLWSCNKLNEVVPLCSLDQVAEDGGCWQGNHRNAVHHAIHIFSSAVCIAPHVESLSQLAFGVPISVSFFTGIQQRYR